MHETRHEIIRIRNPPEPTVFPVTGAARMMIACWHGSANCIQKACPNTSEIFWSILHYSATLFCSVPFSSLSSVLTHFPFPSTLLYATLYMLCDSILLFYSTVLLYCALRHFAVLWSTLLYCTLNFITFHSTLLCFALLCSTLPLLCSLLYSTLLYSTLLEGWIKVKDSFHNETGAARMMISCWHGSAKWIQKACPNTSGNG